MEESHETHRPHIKVGKDEEKKKKCMYALCPGDFHLIQRCAIQQCAIQWCAIQQSAIKQYAIQRCAIHQCAILQGFQKKIRRHYRPRYIQTEPCYSEASL